MERHLFLYINFLVSISWQTGTGCRQNLKKIKRQENICLLKLGADKKDRKTDNYSKREQKYVCHVICSLVRVCCMAWYSKFSSMKFNNLVCVSNIFLVRTHSTHHHHPPSSERLERFQNTTLSVKIPIKIKFRFISFCVYLV